VLVVLPVGAGERMRWGRAENCSPLPATTVYAGTRMTPLQAATDHRRRSNASQFVKGEPSGGDRH
jgi:hypothetical protein